MSEQSAVDTEQEWWAAIVGINPATRRLIIPLEDLKMDAFRTQKEAEQFAAKQDLPTDVCLLEAP